MTLPRKANESVKKSARRAAINVDERVAAVLPEISSGVTVPDNIHIPPRSQVHIGKPAEKYAVLMSPVTKIAAALAP